MPESTQPIQLVELVSTVKELDRLNGSEAASVLELFRGDRVMEIPYGTQEPLEDSTPCDTDRGTWREVGVVRSLQSAHADA